jgi:hypothetical protein
MMLPLKCYVEKNGSFSRRIRFVEKNHFESDFDLNDIQSITRVECYFVDRDINLEDTWVILFGCHQGETECRPRVLRDPALSVKASPFPLSLRPSILSHNQWQQES